MTNVVLIVRRLDKKNIHKYIYNVYTKHSMYKQRPRIYQENLVRVNYIIDIIYKQIGE